MCGCSGKCNLCGREEVGIACYLHAWLACWWSQGFLFCAAGQSVTVCASSLHLADGRCHDTVALWRRLLLRELPLT